MYINSWNIHSIKIYLFPAILTYKLLYSYIYEILYKVFPQRSVLPGFSPSLFLHANSLNGLFEQRTFPLVVGRRHYGLFYTYFGSNGLRRCHGTLFLRARMKSSYRYCDMMEFGSELNVMEEFHNENTLQVCWVL